MSANWHIARRVLARFLQQAETQRSKARGLTNPINKPKGFDRQIVKDQGVAVDDYNDETVKPGRKDVRPEDVFPGTPNQMGVLNCAQTGHGLEKALDKQIPKDKGHDTVSNLSQYLIRTEGGGDTKPVG